MKVVILAGGRGTRLGEETRVNPKPMVEIGYRPILWHIMKHFAHYGHREFFLALGYRGEVIKHYFLHYRALQGNCTIELATGTVRSLGGHDEDWTVNLIETGDETNTGGRVLRLKPWLGDEPFLLTYGDGVSDVDLDRLLAFHRSHGRIATLTAVRPADRFGVLSVEGDGTVAEFTEKPDASTHWVNGGFLVLEPAFFEYLVDDTTGLDVLANVARDGQLVAYRHEGYWQCLDNLRDKWRLEEAWASGSPPWKTWT